tara:strand:+ start:1815 stop:5033 length:3219 start_codon:yes stop_codon:yes gene_type:complete
MSKKIRLPNGRYIKVKTNDLELAKERAAEYYRKGGEGFIDGKTQRLAEAYDTNFDYDTGVDAPWLRTKLGAQETLLGKEKVLEEAVGTNGYTIDSSGKLALTPLGLERMGIPTSTNQNVVIDESGFAFGDLADFSGVVGPIVGSIAGSIITRGKIKPKVPGIKTKTLMDIGKISVGTGTGAVVGKSGEEALEYVSGLQDQSPGELAELAAQEFAIGAGGEFVFGVGGKLLKSTFGQNAINVQGTQIGKDKLLKASALAGPGVRDGDNVYKGAVALAALESPLIGRLQPILETIGGSKSRVKGLEDTLIATLKNNYRATNDLTEQFSKSIEDIKSSGFADATSDVVAGRAIRNVLEKQEISARKALDVAESKLDESVNNILRNMDAFAEPATTETGFAIREFTEQAYKSWKDTSDDLYAQVNKFFEKDVNLADLAAQSGQSVEEFSALLPRGGKITEQLEWIDATPIRTYADLLDAKLIGKGVSEEDEIRKSLQFLKDLGGNDSTISLENLLRIRSDLATKARATAEGVDFAKFSDLERTNFLDSIDRIINNLANGDDYAVKLYANAVGRKGVTPKLADQVKSHMDALKIANSYFARGLQAFDKPTFKGILNDAQAGGFSTDQILTKVLKKNNGQDLKRFLDTLDFKTAGIRKQYDEVGRVSRSGEPSRVPFLKEGGEDILAKADIKLNQTVFENKEQVRNMLQREFIRNLVKNINRTGNMNYNKLANAIDGYGTTADELFGGSASKNEFLKTLRDTEELVNVGSLDEFNNLITSKSSAQGIQDALKERIIAQADLQDIQKLDVFRRIQRGTIDPEEIVAKIFKPASSEEIVKVKELLGGADSDAFKQFQETAMRKILEDVVNPGEDVITKLFNDGAFVKAIDRYGSEVLEQTFGKEQTKALIKAKDVVKFAMDGERAAGGGSLFTQGFLFKYIFDPVRATGVFTPIRLMANLLGRPQVIKWLAGDVSNKEFARQIPTILDYYGVAFPAAKVGASQLGIREVIEGVEEGERFLETDGIDPRAPLTGGSQTMARPPQVSLDLPEVQSVPTGAVARRGPTLLPNPRDQEIAELLS